MHFRPHPALLKPEASRPHLGKIFFWNFQGMAFRHDADVLQTIHGKTFLPTCALAQPIAFSFYPALVPSGVWEWLEQKLPGKVGLTGLARRDYRKAGEEEGIFNLISFFCAEF